MYKLSSGDNIQRVADGVNIPKAPGNRDYTQFLDDIKEHGTNIVEGADVVELDYSTLRTGPDGYLPMDKQMEILTESGVEALQAANNAIKEKFPKTITGGKSIAPLPDWVIDHAAT